MPRTKKMLKTTATGTENLVGRSSKRLKAQLSQENKIDNETTKVNKETQVNLEITIDDLTNPKEASVRYWQILADKRLVALEKSIEENKKLMKVIEDLKQEIAYKDKLLEEANSFVEVIKEELANASNNDTGIDVNDVSTLEDTVDDTNNTENDTAEQSVIIIGPDASKDHK